MTTLLLALLAVAPVQEPSGEGAPDPLRYSSQPRKEDGFKRLWEFLTHPFRDNGRRFDRYPYAGEGPYFLTHRTSDKMYAGLIHQGMGRISHDLLSFGTETMVSWSAGCDARIDSLMFVEEVSRRFEHSQVHHVHLDIGTFAELSPVDYTFGFGIGALDTKDTNGFGPSLRAAVRGFPMRPFSFRMDAVVTWFRDETIADLRAEIGLHVGRAAMTLGVRSLLRSEGDDWTGPALGFAIYF
jgi:hypothetical protein